MRLMVEDSQQPRSGGQPNAPEPDGLAQRAPPTDSALLPTDAGRGTAALARRAGGGAAAPTEASFDAATLPTAQTRLLDPQATRAQDAAGRGRQDLAGTVWGDFRLGELIGSGGMGSVYRGHQLSLDRPVAIKVLGGHLSGSEAFRQRFLLEARSIAQISSPHVVQVYTAGIFESHHFFVMELVDGTDLARMLDDGFKPTNAQAFDLVLQAARGLAAAGKLGIVHRDIKPGNMLITPERVLKITDFGLVKLLRDQGSGGHAGHITGTGTIVGTASYFSPEQGLGEPCDRRTDIYALGVVAFELLAGRLPFTGEDPTSVIYQHVHEDAPPLRTINPSVHPALARAIARCMHKKAEHRFQTADELVAELERIALQGHISAAPGRRWLRWGAAAALIAGAIIGASIFGLSKASRAAPAPEPGDDPQMDVRHESLAALGGQQGDAPPLPSAPALSAPPPALPEVPPTTAADRPAALPVPAPAPLPAQSAPPRVSAPAAPSLAPTPAAAASGRRRRARACWRPRPRRRPRRAPARRSPPPTAPPPSRRRPPSSHSLRRASLRPCPTGRASRIPLSTCRHPCSPSPPKTATWTLPAQPWWAPQPRRHPRL